ncbi:MAG: uroporphyrinogen decarboxylase family protein [Phycisphaerae bacterium]
MTGRERVQAAIRCQPTDRIPWVPFVGCHAGQLLDIPAGDFLRSEEHVVHGVQKGIELYEPDGVPVLFDLQIEAEAMGCEIAWSHDNPPMVAGHPLQDGKTLADIPMPSATDGRLGLAVNATGRLREANPEVALYGLVTGPFTLALHLLGTDIFMKMFDEPETVIELMDFASRVARNVGRWYVEAGTDVVAVVDPMTSQIGPDQFRQFVSPHAAAVFDEIRSAGALSSFFVCGHAQQNIEVMCETGPDNVSIDENIPLQYVRDVCLPRGISFGGNMQLTTVLLLGSEVDAQKNAIECMEVGGEKGFLLAPGCDLPYATPPANLIAVGEVVRDEYKRDVVRAMAAEEGHQQLLDMSEYGQSDKVVVDIITLDSEGCAPCQYMVESVRRIAPQFEGIVEWREHKIKYREALVFMTSLMVRNIPTICIDGRITFVSRIPSREELIEAIQKRIFEKLRIKIQRRRASVFVLGEDNDECRGVLETVRQAVTELGVDVEVRQITDEDEIRSYGVSPRQTPAVLSARYQVKSTRTSPELPIIKEWIKDLL